MRLLRTLIFLWNLLLAADGSYSLILRIVQICGGGVVSIIPIWAWIASPTMHVIIAVVTFIVFIIATDKLILLFRKRMSARIIQGIKKTKRTNKVFELLRNIDSELHEKAVKASREGISLTISNKNAIGLLELMGIGTKKIRKWKLVADVSLKPLMFYSFRQREFLLELAILMDSNKAGLDMYQTMASKLRQELGLVDVNAINATYRFLDWAYGINSLLLLSSRDIPKSLALMPTRRRTKIQKLAYKSEQMIEILLVSTMTRIGILEDD